MPTKEQVILQMIKSGLVLDYSGSLPEGTSGNTPSGTAKAQHDLLASVAGKLRLPISVNSRSRSAASDVEGILTAAGAADLDVIVGAHDILDLNDEPSISLMSRLYDEGARFFIAPAGFTVDTVGRDRQHYRRAALVGGSTSLEGWREQHQIGADLVLFPGANLRPNDLGTYWPVLHRRVPMGISGPIIPEALRNLPALKLAVGSGGLQQVVQPYINGGALFVLNGWPIKQGDVAESIEKCALYLNAIQDARAAAPSPINEMHAAIANRSSLQGVADALQHTSTPLRFQAR